MILDEVTASMDLETENIMKEIINDEFRNSTLIIVAHRISTILNCDKILVLDEGKVAEFDTPQNLRNNPNSLFAKLTENLNEENIK